VIEEIEPNDTPGAGVPVSLAPAGRILEIRGVLEPPEGGAQAYDRYQAMIPARTLLHVRVARTSPRSLLEPAVIVRGGAFVTPRIAEGLFLAEREIYVSAAGLYEIAVADRRGALDGEPKGSAEDGYALAISVISATPERVVPPLFGRAFRLAPAGKVGLFEADLAASLWTRLETETNLGRGLGTEGIDTILVLETDGGATVIENDDLAPGISDSRLLLPLSSSQPGRIVIDHERIFGTGDLEVALRIDEPRNDAELEPNGVPELASRLVFPGETKGEIGAPLGDAPDVDWYAIDAAAGQVAAFHALLEPGSMFDPFLLLGHLEGGSFVPDYANGDSSGVTARLDAIFHTSGTFHLAVFDERNTERPFRGGELFRYRIFAEVSGIQPVSVLTSSGTLSGAINPGGKIIRHVVTTRDSAVLALETRMKGIPELAPFFRVYGPQAIGLLGQGEERAIAFLPTAASYVVGVHNAREGAGSAEHTYEVFAELAYVAAGREGEPNDAPGEEGALGGIPAVVEGGLESTNDVDRYSVSLRAGMIGDAVLTIGGRNRTIDVFTAGARVPLASSADGLVSFTVPADGRYIVRLSSSNTAGAYTFVLRAR
jgi:hypothetical protein